MINRTAFIPTRDLIIFPGIITPLFIGREKSMATLEKALMDDNSLVLCMQKDAKVEVPVLPDGVHEIGVLVNILQTLKMPNGNVKVLVEAKNRIRLKNVIEEEKYFVAEYEDHPEIEISQETGEALKRKVLYAFEKYAKLTNKVLPDLIVNLKGIKNVNKVLDLISSNLHINNDKKQEILNELDVEKRAFRLLEIIEKEIEIVAIERKIDSKVKEKMNNMQKNYYLKEKINALREELGENSGDNDEVGELRKAVEGAKISKNLKEKLHKELDRLSKMPQFSSEASVIRSYVETVIELPWNKKSKESLDIAKAKEILDEDHYSLDKIKERILEFLAVKKLNNKLKGSIICFVGPPGVGKTSLAHSIARAMNREFVRISLGGVRDEAEIRGHRRTYIGSMPGRVIKAIKEAGTKNPLLLLDEIDKMAMDFRGDPASAMLEVLDPNQNKHFEDHYIDAPFDLSDVFFIATANDLGSIPMPLRDRMEIIMLSSYTEFEKKHIAKKYLLPEAKEENGLLKCNVKISDEALMKVINEYTREAGVRNLRREINRLHRRIAKEVVEKDKKSISITLNNIEKYLDKPRYRPDKQKDKEAKTGIVNGLAWTSVGGTTLEVQAIRMEGKGKLTLTGKLGEVMKESAQVAYSFVRAEREEFKLEDKFNEKYDIHLHFPEGAVPKDGPSAGITITTALISALGQRPVRQDIAMTGEITITGEVLPVGGIKEKVIGAHRVGIREVILPLDNSSDVDELPKEVIKDMTIHFAKKYAEVEDIVFKTL
jgi:ATP-dependent Lon protease